MGQCGQKEGGDFNRAQAICLERAKHYSGNPALTSARYHIHSSRSLTTDYTVDGTVLGRGLCGDVVLVLGKVDKRRFALKTIRKTRVVPAKLRQLITEVEIYLGLDHPNVAKLHNVYERDSDILLITECCDGGELYARLSARGVYTNNDAAEAARQMLLAVGYLHSHYVVHRDLKLENFLYESEAPSAALKLIDFGFAKIWNSSSLMLASCGSIAYVSPDVLSGKGYTNKCDMWSLGVIVWMLLCGYPPFHGNEQTTIRCIKAGEADWSHTHRWEAVSEDAINFVQQLLQRDPDKRPDAKAALQHPWLTSTASTTASRGLRALGKDLLRALEKYAKSSKVRRMVLQFMAQELTADETAELRDLFLSMDQDNKGTISLRELKAAIRMTEARSPRRSSHGGSPKTYMSESSPASSPERLRRAPSEILDELCGFLDANGDEQIYYSDFLAATLEARQLLSEEAMRAAFHRLDADNSGLITSDDFRSVIGESFEGTGVDALVLEADLDGRGEISFDSFVSVLRDKTPLAVREVSDFFLEHEQKTDSVPEVTLSVSEQDPNLSSVHAMIEALPAQEQGPASVEVIDTPPEQDHDVMSALQTDNGADGLSIEDQGRALTPGEIKVFAEEEEEEEKAALEVAEASSVRAEEGHQPSELG
eukprot:CAMPEP_0170601918 /NCGR_PEP_ID=MMETSP0224-20130122/18116_1 /TAXON_ID=285029 /ORGANISM="Togula jolla, Strain CCCM 725" /LENGTH=651 /DNA_ID=CAMNT_0010926727 /DNA_START=29 /DNA_END=1981 /DNA_ORIENTATION=-